MGSKSQAPDKSGRSWLRIAAAAVIIIAFVCALWVNFGVRAPVEARDKTVGLFVDYDELTRLANGIPDAGFGDMLTWLANGVGGSFGDMLTRVRDAGATGIVVRERLLGEWEAAGDVITFAGGSFAFYLQNLTGSDAEAGGSFRTVNIAADKTYILTKNDQVYEQIFSMLDAKQRHPEAFTIPGYRGISALLHSSERATLGLGFPIARLTEAAAAGFEIIPRLRNWDPLTEEGLAEVFRLTSMIPNLTAVGFNDQTVPGGGTDTEIQDLLADAIAPLGKPIVSFEFYEQTGLPGLAGRLDNNLLRVHAIADNEMRLYTDFQVAMDRYSLAVRERNIRYIYMKMQNLTNPGASVPSNLETISGVHDWLTAEGFTVSSPEPLSMSGANKILLFFLGAGIIASGGWLLVLAAEPYVKKNRKLPFLVLMLACCAVWAGLMFAAPTLSRKLMALAGAITFPSLSVLLVLIGSQDAPNTGKTGAKLLRAAGQLALMSAITFIGSMIVSALLAEPAFMLKLDSFFGVKVSHVIPLILVPCILWLRVNGWFGIIYNTIEGGVKFRHIIIGAALLAGFIILIMRTGNESPQLVSSLETKVRQLLADVLGVRPRTKEFLIGHPIMLILLFFGYKRHLFPLVMVGTIGQISIINTYEHLHTPLFVSLIRSINGMWIGIIIGAIAAAVLLCINRRIKKSSGNTVGKRLRV